MLMQHLPTTKSPIQQSLALTPQTPMTTHSHWTAVVAQYLCSALASITQLLIATNSELLQEMEELLTWRALLLYL